MNILDIYKQYPITTLLEQHQLRAAAFGALIADSLQDKEVDKEAIIKTLLIHDMGNIIKFDFTALTMFSDEEKATISELKEKQKSFREKYHNDEHIATYEIAKEIGVSDSVYFLLTHTGSSKLQAIIDGENWDLKVIVYADLRSAPYGLATVEERFNDLLERYTKRGDTDIKAAEVEKRKQLCLDVEKQLQKFIHMDVNSISERNIQSYLSFVSSYSLP